MKNKKFDCVEMKRQGAQKVLEKTSKMTREEELRFWQERSQKLKQSQSSTSRHSLEQQNLP